MHASERSEEILTASEAAGLEPPILTATELGFLDLPRSREPDESFDVVVKSGKCHCERDDPDGVEITPEMIEAGVAELGGFIASDIVDGFLNPADVVVAIYRAMLESRHQD